MLFVYAEYEGWGMSQSSDSARKGNHWELIEADSEEELEKYLWDLRCEEVSDLYHDDEEEEWCDFVESNSNCHVYFPYDKTKEGHIELSGYEDERPEYAELMREVTKQARADRIAKLKYNIHNDSVLIEKLHLTLANNKKELNAELS